MKLFLYRRIVAQEKSILYATHFSADTTDRIVRTTSKALAGALLLDFRGRFTRSLISSQHKLSWIEERAKCAARRRAYLDKIVLESSHLRDILNEIELD